MTINCRGQLIDLSTPKVMGIINITPDSFYDGGSLKSDSDIINRAELMLKEGATFLDIGGYSSRPGANNISIDEELSRAVPVVEVILKNFPEAFISIDTFRSKVAREAVNAGAALVNDISAGNLDGNMLQTVAELAVPYIMMHMKGTPQTMKHLTDYDNLIKEMIYYFSERISEAVKLQLKDIIVDPGFGFAKTIEQNYEILRKLDILSMLEKPLLVGFSRKSMIYKPLGSNSDEALNGTTVLNTIAIQKNAKILRVHDVKEAVECIKLSSMLN